MENNEKNIPQYLYHYTSIETLALILKHRSIRFNSLDKMDDLQEKEAADIKNIGQFIYISAWTAEQEESIPMWNMYSSLDSGVRIRLKSNPFYKYDNTIHNLQRVTKLNVVDNDGVHLPSYISIPQMFEQGFCSVQAMGGAELHKVEYTNDKQKLYPSIVDSNETQFTIKLGELGKYKNMHWEFQKEWRYILQIIPLNINQNPDEIMSSFLMIANRIRMGLEKQPFPYYDMKIDDEIFNAMEITMSPKISAGNKVILESLVSDFNPNAIIKESMLKNLI